MTEPTTEPTLLERDLTAADLEHLEFARATWKYQGRREGAVRERFGISLTQHIQRVLAILEHPQAAAYDAQLVNRLRDLRDRRAAVRSRGFGAV